MKAACENCICRATEENAGDAWYCGGIHKTWHTLTKYLKQWYYTKSHGWKKDMTPSKRIFRHYAPEKVHGYEAMTRIGRFLRLFGGIEIVSCDDSAHCGSSIILIPHETEDEYWGTTIMNVPQCIDERGEMFLYPHHLNNLIEKLQELQERQAAKNAYEDND